MISFIKPVLTEKANLLTEENNSYTFIVSTKSNKVEIKKHIEKLYGITVEAVNTINLRIERRKRYTKNGIQSSKSTKMKKAIVKIKEGDSIDFYNNI